MHVLRQRLALGLAAGQLHAQLAHVCRQLLDACLQTLQLGLRAVWGGIMLTGTCCHFHAAPTLVGQRNVDSYCGSLLFTPQTPCFGESLKHVVCPHPESELLSPEVLHVEPAVCVRSAALTAAPAD